MKVIRFIYVYGFHITKACCVHGSNATTKTTYKVRTSARANDGRVKDLHFFCVLRIHAAMITSYNLEDLVRIL